jgi:hypothetical protein
MLSTWREADIERWGLELVAGFYFGVEHAQRSVIRLKLNRSSLPANISEM